VFVDPVPDPWRAQLEAHWGTVRAEMELLREEQWVAWAPPVHNYAHGASIVPLRLKYQPPWLQFDGEKHQSWLPRTAQLVDGLPGTYTACLSRMLPGARVAAHRDLDEAGFLRIHLGLATDPQARFRCGGEWRSWQEGRCLAFHGASEHEVVHDGTRPRVVLIVDVDAESLARHRRDRVAGG
jgi:aspartyl/asparaginyl beta-hydroxylase (cupin superfamily)